MSGDLSLYFYPVEIKEVLDEIANINVSIAELVESISMMRENCDIFGQKIILDFDSSIRFYWIFTPEMKKIAGITPIFKNTDMYQKGNFCPVSILPSLSKID